ncbi:MAG: translation elongation factor Ts [Puniceicoccales bacterium]|jgi:elongation factor Ts|nr:translation elongation factor Ts [Puniceicoccales bacterium]
MADITAKQVNDLRVRTGAGLMDCKKALVEAAGDADAAAEILRKKGAATRDKKAGRAANEGTVQVFVSDDGKTGALVEVNCESDFVGKNELFQSFVKRLAAHVAATGVVENLAEQVLHDDPSRKVNDLVTEQVTKTGENLVLGRVKLLKAGADGRIQSYLHNGGKIGVLVEVAAPDTEAEAFKALAKGVAMHIAAVAPQFLHRGQVPAETVEKEKEIATAAARAEGKPEGALPNIVNGKLNKFFGEVCLVDQPYVLENKSTVADSAKKAAGAEVKNFVRVKIGE